ncbi:TIGR02757 family protein [Sediminibacterium sp. TEGAF015]|uniref:TIGR02757 family protein n=1 Tax=Sediminibacterium sp. TEGAF015 TaxID=575378 RepID=UPI002203347D|nr:TIGR02757 family protein [Sediminibacterium sp. TEGAF015]BDQ12570.1 TIGR02757 family protein [Sediminibacterium sp. TEGAF015]
MGKTEKLQAFFNRKVKEYNQPAFIAADPVCIPHLFVKKQDIEIAGFFAAIFAWGNRTTIIKKAKELMQLMEMQPHQFCLEAGPVELKKLEQFKHRTFNATDLLYCVEFFRKHYQQYDSLEYAFMPGNKAPNSVKEALSYFHHYFFSLEDAPLRTRKHISTPEKGSSCKRLNMFLRWMVRKDKQGVDLGIWTQINPSQLICPIDVHVARVAKRFQLLDCKQTDWQAAEELTNYLKKLDPKDPAKYDFALFGLGVIEKY